MVRVAGRASGGVAIFADKAAEMASTNQFFYFILDCFTFLCDMTVVSVIATVFSHVRIGGSGRLAWRWDEVGL